MLDRQGRWRCFADLCPFHVHFCAKSRSIYKKPTPCTPQKCGGARGRYMAHTHFSHFSDGLLRPWSHGMTTDAISKGPQVVRQKSPGRVRAGKLLHERGLASMGGRRPTHGRAALVELLKRGLEGGGDEIAALHRSL